MKMADSGELFDGSGNIDSFFYAFLILPKWHRLPHCFVCESFRVGKTPL